VVPPRAPSPSTWTAATSVSGSVFPGVLDHLHLLRHLQPYGAGPRSQRHHGPVRRPPMIKGRPCRRAGRRLREFFKHAFLVFVTSPTSHSPP
jgi:hypothetical protein